MGVFDWCVGVWLVIFDVEVVVVGYDLVYVVVVDEVEVVCI